METIYDQMGGMPAPPKEGEPSKRDKHRAGQLTGKVWDAIEVETLRGDDGLVDVRAYVGDIE